MQQIADRIKETTATVGVGALALAGAATGYRPFSAVCAIADTCYYAIEGVNNDGTLTGEWEVGFGTYSALNTLTRTTVLASSNAGAAVNFAAGTKAVWLDLPAAHINDFARLSQADSFAMEIGVRVASSTDASISVAAPSGAATTLHAEKIDATAPATATVALYGVKAALRTVAAAFTLAAAVHFSANAASVGAGSAVTTVKGFEAANAIAVGTNNYGYWTDFAAAANKYAFYGSGTAQSFFGGEVGVISLPTALASLKVGRPPTTGVNADVINLSATGLATLTNVLNGVSSNLGTSAAAYTLTNAVHFYAVGTTKGAGSTITNSYGFRVDNAIAVGTNNYGFYSALNSAATTWQLYMSGTANSFIGGALGVGPGTSDPLVAGMLLYVGGNSAHPATITSIYGTYVDYIAPSTATGGSTGYRAVLRTVASAFTLSAAICFDAASITKGAGATITNAYGFKVGNSIAGTATNTYGFYSDVNSASATYQLYMSGTAQSHFNGPVGIAQTDPLTNGMYLAIGSGAVAHPATSVIIYGAATDYIAPSTATSGAYGYYAIVRSANTAFTLGQAVCFFAGQVVKGAASTITNARGFYASNNIAVAANNYGFYSDITLATATWQLFMGGTGASQFNGPISMGNASYTFGAFIIATMPSSVTDANPFQFKAFASFASTSTGTASVYSSTATTAAAAFTCNTLIHFDAAGAALGAGSAITNVRGFAARNAIVLGTNNFGFWSDIAAAANTFQLSMQGSGASRFGGPVYHAQDNSTVQAVSALYQGTGVPNNANGNNGDFYLRGDTPGTANQRLYVKSAGAWVGIV